MEFFSSWQKFIKTHVAVVLKIFDGVIANQELNHQTSYGIISKNQNIIKI